MAMVCVSGDRLLMVFICFCIGDIISHLSRSSGGGENVATLPEGGGNMVVLNVAMVAYGYEAVK
jgi:hypothetical protein